MIKKGKNQEMLNNGELVYTYVEAERMGISRSAFLRALDDLIGRGFIKVSRTGAGTHKLTTLYALTDAWKKYGTPDFKTTSRQRTGSRYKRVGFKKGHEYYGVRRKEGSDESGPKPGEGHGGL